MCLFISGVIGCDENFLALGEGGEEGYRAKDYCVDYESKSKCKTTILRSLKNIDIKFQKLLIPRIYFGIIFHLKKKSFSQEHLVPFVRLITRSRLVINIGLFVSFELCKH